MTTPPPRARPRRARLARPAAALAALGTLAACVPSPPDARVEPDPAAVAASGHFTTSDGVRLHYLTAGRGRPVLFVPGWAIAADIWEPQLRALQARYRVVALDPRSQGRSGHAPGGHYHARRARDIRELIEHLGLADVTLVGWSLAVKEALAYVEQFGTDRLAALVLVDGGVYAARVDAEARHATMVEMQRDRRAYLERFVRGMYATPQPEAYLRRVTEAALRTPADAALALFFDLYFGPERDQRRALARVDRPVLFVAAGRRGSHADTVAAYVPSTRVEVFDGAGHALFVDQPERFNALLEAFLRSTATPPAERRTPGPPAARSHRAGAGSYWPDRARSAWRRPPS